MSLGLLLVGAIYLLLMALALPVLVLLAQVGLGLRQWHAGTDVESTAPTVLAVRPSVAVLVPAHNESAVICATLVGLQTQLHPGDRLLVVADNCVDSTTKVARDTGAEVIERQDITQRGKGFALDFGVRHLATQPPDVLVVVDADCQVKAGSLDILAACVAATGRPVQSLDLMLAPTNAALKTRVAEFAWRVKNWARPLGWHRLGWPCQLMGTGMAFPWAVAVRMDLANGHLVEDMKLGIELALAGTPPLFCPKALVTSQFPVQPAAQQSQRKRWEHGHLSVLLTLAPRLFWRALWSRSVPTMALALDLLVPPVALLAALLAALWLLALGLVLWVGVWGPWVWATGLVLAFKLALALAWLGWGRDLVSAREWLKVPLYLLAKLPLYVGFVFRRQKAWVRTDRQ